jgi:predicted small integral membrane protein
MPIPVDDRIIPAVRYLDTTPVQTTVDAVNTVPNTPILMDTAGIITNPASSLSHYSIMDLVQIFIVYAFIVAAGLAALFIFIGGVNFILSGGDEEKIKKAVNTIRYSIVGLIVTILSFTFVHIVGKIFGLDFMSYLSYNKIRTSITQLIDSSKTTNNTGGSSRFRLPRN